MAKKNIEATAAATEEKKTRVSVNDKARRHIERIINRRVVPMVLDEVLTAYAAIGALKYADAIEMADNYATAFMTQKGEQ